MALNCHSPSAVMKADLARSFWRSGTFQNPDFKSRDVNTVDPLSFERDPSIFGRGYGSMVVTAFNLR